MPARWREAAAAALYGPEGFFTRTGAAPAAHFRTSAHASPLFAAAVLRLLEQVDAALGHPDPCDLVDVGAGRGELLAAVLDAAPARLAARLRPTAVELAPRPADLPPAIGWRARLPSRSPSASPSTTAADTADTADTADDDRGLCGLLVATEWLDNVPVDVAGVDPEGVVRYVLVDPATGAEHPGEPVSGPDADWLARWWPLREPGARAEIGRPRDDAWAQAVAAVYRGAALAVDYGHVAPARPPFGTLAGYRDGRQVAPVPDGSCDLTAHVAMDAVADAADTVAGADANPDAMLTTQREALRALGVDATRPPLALAHRDPTAYLRRLATAGAAGELTDPAGLGGHYWLLQPVSLPHPLRPFVAR